MKYLPTIAALPKSCGYSLLLTCFALISIDSSHAQKRPNIIIIMADDMGYSDIGCYGSEIDTPHLDRLAKNGIRFSQFYNTARCCPTRASLLTGLHPHQAGMGHMAQQHTVRANALDVPPAYQGWINRNCLTIAEALSTSGYRNYMAGKWHVSTLDKDNWPRARGFDRYYGLINGASNFFKPAADKHLTRESEQVQKLPPDFYTTDYFTKNAISFLDDHAKNHQDKPFFLYLAFTCPHWPLQAWPEDIKKYRGKYANGWDETRRKRIAKMKRLGLLKEDLELSPRDPKVPAWSSLNADKQKGLSDIMAIYAAMVDRMDQNIGKVIGKLEKENWLDNTLILFLADNGACEEGPPLGRWKPGQLGSKEGYADPRYGNCWANVSNTPFKMYKHWVHEGGISSPLIAHWPKGIDSELSGKISHSYGYLPDLMATCVDVSKTKYPDEYEGRNIKPLEGKSFAEVFTDLKFKIHREPICWEHEGNGAIRNGNWKLVKKNRSTWELYDLSLDRSELSNVAEQHPDVVKKMSKQWDAWARRVGVLDWDKYGSLRKKAQQARKAKQKNKNE